jgi:hypothetical protein
MSQPLFELFLVCPTFAILQSRAQAKTQLGDIAAMLLIML